MVNFSDVANHVTSPRGVDRLAAIGDVLQYAIAWTAIIIVAFSGITPLAYAWVYAGICQLIVVEVLKRSLDHTTLGIRPNGGDYSFPCGHTSSAFFGASFITTAWGFTWGILPLILAVVTGVSRVASRQHWPRDVIAGAIIATVCSYTVVRHMVG